MLIPVSTIDFGLKEKETDVCGDLLARVEEYTISVPKPLNPIQWRIPLLYLATTEASPLW